MCRSAGSQALRYPVRRAHQDAGERSDEDKALEPTARIGQMCQREQKRGDGDAGECSKALIEAPL